MAETRANHPVTAAGANCFKEAVCINANRIYDSCSDKDCLEDLRVYFTDRDQPVIDQAISIKVKDVQIINAYLDVETVPFNKGFYSVDITFFFAVKVAAMSAPLTRCESVTGIATFQKKVILYGSEGNVKTYASGENRGCLSPSSFEPRALVQAVDPICLSSRLVEYRECGDDVVSDLPAVICNCFDGDFAGVDPVKAVYVTLGLFTIVLLERKVQMMIPAYDFCIPDKECVTTTDDPCQLFQRIKFPTDEFFPPNLADLNGCN